MNRHHNMHWAILVAVSIFVGVFLVGQIHITYYANQAQAASSVLATSDLTCAGAFLTPGVPTGNGTYYFPMAMRYENGNRHYFMYAGDSHVYEFPEPQLLPCNTPTASLNRASLESWGGDWGYYIVHEKDDYIPNSYTQSVDAYGMNYDNVASRLLLSWSGNYSNTAQRNSFAAATLNDTTHTLTTKGCWGLNNTNTTVTGTGILNIPSSFVNANLPSGARWGVGFGGSLGQAASASYGPTLFATIPPADNPCAPATNYPVDYSKILALYLANYDGPTCSDLGIGCTPTQPPTPPYAAQLAFNKYSEGTYGTIWDPWGGHGWFGYDMYHSIGWYDDGIKQGVVVPIQVPEGWLNTSVLANPAPTIDDSGYTPTGAFYVSSTSTHDGLNVNPGDLMWIQTCTVGVDPGCDSTANGRNLSFIIVDSVNSATGRIAFHIYNADVSSGTHKPVVGSPVLFGCVYFHGQPACSRSTYRLQIYDPAQYAQVAAGTRQPYDVKYNEEIDLTNFVKAFGSPESGSGVTSRFVYDHYPSSTIVDNSAKQIMMAFTNGNSPRYQESNLVYVFNTGSGSVTPPLAPQPSPAPSPSPSPIPSPTPSPSSPTPGPTTSLNVGPTAGTGAGSLVQSASGISSGTVSLPSPVSAGNTIVVAIAGWYGTTADAVTDGVNTYTRALEYAGSNYSQDSAIYYAHNIKAGTPAIHISGGVGAAVTGVSVMEMKGDYILSDTSSNSALTGAPDSGAAITPSAGFGVSLALSQLGVVNTPGSGWTKIAENINVSMAMYRQIATAGSYSATADYVYRPWEISIATFKPNTSSTPAPAPTPSPISSPIAGDLNSDGIVNSLDWSIMSLVWFTANSAADLNHDGIVNSIDFSILNRNWFKSS